MSQSVYKVIEVVGSSPNSWEDAAKNAVQAAGKKVRNLRVAEVVEQDLKLDGTTVVAYRVRLHLSFKYEL